MAMDLTGLADQAIQNFYGVSVASAMPATDRGQAIIMLESLLNCQKNIIALIERYGVSNFRVKQAMVSASEIASLANMSVVGRGWTATDLEMTDFGFSPGAVFYLCGCDATRRCSFSDLIFLLSQDGITTPFEIDATLKADEFRLFNHLYSLRVEYPDAGSIHPTAAKFPLSFRLVFSVAVFIIGVLILSCSLFDVFPHGSDVDSNDLLGDSSFHSHFSVQG